ncbi:branched-chain amino acid aminotransferase [Arcanobacterium pinnipediorum]|uniref:branched-chain-amino-acid transaminase n=1 Tax=Arcanobacterium pinnipediorum TaxID=1503041 RepID=A0ABY5AKQ9_9ACTO|nr:branched-chain amino acid aminotransferase [Arcanobacterium pinnipediorum]USR79793.1 branched-chain amino acid aminotransferase [Arcanobacterium pinnipediorum]
MTSLEEQASSQWPLAQALQDRFVRYPHQGLKTDDEYNAVMAQLDFGAHFTDYMARASWDADRGWHGHRIEPYAPLSLDPAGAVLHYGQEVFEGLKAYRHADGSVWTFRPAYNAARLNESSQRLMIPDFPIPDFLASLVGLVSADRRWVPQDFGASLYLRPFIFASEAFLGVRGAQRFDYAVVASPSGPYFSDGLKPINVWVERDHHRAGPGGMGNVKTGGNYAASFFAKAHAQARGFDEVLFLDAATNSRLDELGAMNVFVVMADGRVRTPALSGTILPGSTRSAILQMLDDDGVDVFEESLALDEVWEGIKDGTVTEMFACGTAASVVPIGSLTVSSQRVELGSVEFSRWVFSALADIHYGRAADRFGWMYKVADAV